MKQRLFEDDQMYDIQRQTTGMGTEITDPGAMRVDAHLAHKNKDSDFTNPNKLFPVDGIEQAVADAFINVSNAQKLVSIAKENPTFKKKQENLNALEKKLSDITSLLVDFDEIISKI